MMSSSALRMARSQKRSNCSSLHMEFKVATVTEVTCWPSAADIEMCWGVLLRLSVCLRASSPSMN